MKKFLLIVNTTVFIILLSYILLPSKIVAQTQTISPSELGQGNSNPLSLLQELLRILFSFTDTPSGGLLPPLTPYPNISINPSFTISPFVTYPPPPPGVGYIHFAQCGNPPSGTGDYGSTPLPSGCTLCKAGCGPTAVAMIVASLVDRSINPPRIVDHYRNNNYFL